MAIQQMHKGQVAKVLCPAHLDKGGSNNNFRQSGTSWIKEGTDITYEFEVQSCVAQLDFPMTLSSQEDVCLLLWMTILVKNSR